MCKYLQDNNFEVLVSAIALDKVDLNCAYTFKAKPTRNSSDFITYSNTINFDSKWLEKSGYIITQWGISKITGFHMVQKLLRNKKVIKVGKLVEKITS